MIMGKAMQCVGAGGTGNLCTFDQFCCKSVTAIEKSSL